MARARGFKMRDDTFFCSKQKAIHQLVFVAKEISLNAINSFAPRPQQCESHHTDFPYCMNGQQHVNMLVKSCWKEDVCEYDGSSTHEWKNSQAEIWSGQKTEEQTMCSNAHRINLLSIQGNWNTMPDISIRPLNFHQRVLTGATSAFWLLEKLTHQNTNPQTQFGGKLGGVIFHVLYAFLIWGHNDDNTSNLTV